VNKESQTQKQIKKFFKNHKTKNKQIPQYQAPSQSSGFYDSHHLIIKQQMQRGLAKGESQVQFTFLWLQIHQVLLFPCGKK
jgi:hypothetical protein